MRPDGVIAYDMIVAYDSRLQLTVGPPIVDYYSRLSLKIFKSDCPDGEIAYDSSLS